MALWSASEEVKTVLCKPPTTSVAHLSLPRARAKVVCYWRLLAWRNVLFHLLFVNEFCSSVLLKPAVHNLKFYSQCSRVLSKREESLFITRLSQVTDNHTDFWRGRC